jgi:hypothetical protein
MFVAKHHAAFDIDLVKFAVWADIGQTSCSDSLKGGNTENGDSMGNPAEKWLAYSTSRFSSTKWIFQQPWPGWGVMFTMSKVKSPTEKKRLKWRVPDIESEEYQP